MKKLLMLLMLLLLAACGGGGGDSVGQQSADDDGIVTVKLSETVAKMANLATPPDPTWVRVVAIQQAPAVKKIIDVPIGSSNQVTLSVPAGTYEFHAIYYVKDGSVNRMLQYGTRSGVAIAAASVTDADVRMSPISVTVRPAHPDLDLAENSPARIFAGQAYGANAPTADPSGALRAEWMLFAQTTPFTNPKHVSASEQANIRAAHGTDLAPESNTPGKLYYQGEFFINSSLIGDTEDYTSWVFTTPNPLYTSTPVFDPNFKVQAILNIASDTFPPRISSFSAPAEMHSTVLKGISISASDNVGVTGYRIHAAKAVSSTSPLYGTSAPALDPLVAGEDSENLTNGWVPPAGSYSADLSTLSLVDGERVVLYAWARDLRGASPSAPMTASVVYRDTPAVTSVVAPTAANGPDDLSYEGIKINAEGTGTPVSFAITESTTAPSSWLDWPTPVATPHSVTTTFAFQSLPNKNGVLQHGTVVRPAYAWVKYENNKVSSPKAFNLLYSDAPVVSFSIPQNELIDRTAGATYGQLRVTLSATAPPTHTLQYAVTTSSAKPTTWLATPPAYVTLTADQMSQNPGTSTTIYGWVKDQNGIVAYKTITIKF